MEVKLIIYIVLVFLVIMLLFFIKNSRQDSHNSKLINTIFNTPNISSLNKLDAIVYNPNIKTKNNPKITSEKSCPRMFPSPPLNIPPSAYAKIVKPEILSSAYNNNFDPCSKEDRDSGKCPNYKDVEYACMTPWENRCTTNDDCAANGVGEICEGPQGNMYCVCESTLKTGSKVKPGDKVSKNDVIISYGGACTEDGQCCTNNCQNYQGLLSKICGCQEEKQFDSVTNKCECSSGTHWEYKESDCLTPWSNSWELGQCNCPEGYTYNKDKKKCIFQHCILDEPTQSKTTCSTAGQSCYSNKDCSLGEECTGDQIIDPFSENQNSYGYCRCNIGSPVKNYEAFLFTGRSNCSDDSQCAKNTTCIEGQCGCNTEKGYYYNNVDGYCKCTNSNESIDPLTGKCTSPYEFKSVICPNTYNVKEKMNPFLSNPTTGLLKGKYCDTDSQCGLGEACDVNHRVCYCNSDVLSDKINNIKAGGICFNNDQCSTGLCKVESEKTSKICSENTTSWYKIAKMQYPIV